MQVSISGIYAYVCGAESQRDCAVEVREGGMCVVGVQDEGGIRKGEQIEGRVVDYHDYPRFQHLR